jgi:hypothetical protein
MANFSGWRQDRIVFEDGRQGTQNVHLYDDGSEELREIHITREADGSDANVVYAAKPDIQAGVFSLSSMPKVKWAIAPGGKGIHQG